MRVRRVAATAVAGMLLAGGAVVATASGAAAGGPYKAGGFGTESSCLYNRMEYARAYLAVGPCWKGEGQQRWYFYYVTY